MLKCHRHRLCKFIICLCVLPAHCPQSKEIENMLQNTPGAGHAVSGPWSGGTGTIFDYPVHISRIINVNGYHHLSQEYIQSGQPCWAKNSKDEVWFREPAKNMREMSYFYGGDGHWLRTGILRIFWEWLRGF